jgi:hypothetical protein
MPATTEHQQQQESHGSGRKIGNNRDSIQKNSNIVIGEF